MVNKNPAIIEVKRNFESLESLALQCTAPLKVQYSFSGESRFTNNSPHKSFHPPNSPAQEYPIYLRYYFSED